jgi:hypothetical protein
MNDELKEKINLLAIQISLSENLIHEYEFVQNNGASGFCIFCYADMDETGDIKHDHDCPVNLSSEILKELDENPSS